MAAVHCSIPTEARGQGSKYQREQIRLCINRLLDCASRSFYAPTAHYWANWNCPFPMNQGYFGETRDFGAQN